MKLLIIFILVISSTACTTHKLYIVRHAEKSTEPKNDPNLTDAGVARAAALQTLLRTEKIEKIYSTNTNRTKQTAEPLSTELNVPIRIYKNDTTKKLLQQIFISKKNTLVVGHSNTILPILDSMKIAHTKTEVPDWEYDNMFVVYYKKYCWDCAKPFKVQKVSFKKYGATSVPNTTNAKMK